MMNSERRISILPRLLPAPGEALPDWEIAALLSRHSAFSSAFGFSHAVALLYSSKTLSRAVSLGTGCRRVQSRQQSHAASTGPDFQAAGDQILHR